VNDGPSRSPEQIALLTAAGIPVITATTVDLEIFLINRLLTAHAKTVSREHLRFQAPYLGQRPLSPGRRAKRKQDGKAGYHRGQSSTIAINKILVTLEQGGMVRRSSNGTVTIVNRRQLVETLRKLTDQRDREQTP
jgi:hypothetical protein